MKGGGMKSRVEWVMIFLLMLGVVCAGCAKDDGDDDDDDDTDWSRYPDALEPCSEPYGEYEPWFEIGDFPEENTEVFGDSGIGEVEAFLPGTVLLAGDNIALEGDGWWLALTWQTDLVEPPFADRQPVQVAVRYTRDGETWAPIVISLWVLDENGETLLFAFPELFSMFAAIENHLYMIEVPLVCEYPEDDQPPLFAGYNYEWEWVFQRRLVAIVGEVGVDCWASSTRRSFSVDGRHAYTVTKNYVGEVADWDIVGYGPRQSEGTFQLVRLAP